MNQRSGTRILALTTLMVIVTGCSTLDPYTREEKTSSATKGALIGAGIGAVVGLISGDDAVDRRQRALIGAGVGALAGGAVGYYMDRQEARLRAELEGTGVSVTRIGDNITLNMPGNVTFATDSSNLSPAFFDVLNSVGKVLDEFDQTVVLMVLIVTFFKQIISIDFDTPLEMFYFAGSIFAICFGVYFMHKSH